MESTKIKLIKNIENSFKNFNLKLDKATLTINNEQDLECAGIQKFYANKIWEDVLLDFNEIDGSNISFMTPEAIAQFIPAFMLYCIQDADNADTLIDNLESFLLNLETDLDMYVYNEKRRQKFFSILLDKQKQVIEDFIEYLMEIYLEDFKFLLTYRIQKMKSSGDSNSNSPTNTQSQPTLK